ncbi:MAG: ABC transporter permease [Chloroflexi bacterium]|jgi:peptide/nickel transport system permease protein|nr:ABC transporter permease [Chloroflexota bacterium]HLG51791.1 ABC transporter permease [Chloroflexota bacterium]
MVHYILRRLLYMVVTIFFISIVGFVLIQLPPGSALSAKIAQLRALGGDLSQDQIRSLEERYGLNDPIQVRYVRWVTGAIHGDFGQSFTFDAPVNSLIWSRIGFSVLLSGCAIIFAWVVSIPIGVYSATHRYTIPDYIVTIIQFVGVAVPDFLLALLLLVFASQVLHTDVGGLFSTRYVNAPWSWGKFLDLLQHLWIPVVVIAAGSTAWLTRVMRANLLDVLNQQYVQTARSKGLTEGVVVWKHAVRNALHPLCMALGQQLPALISGEVIVSIVLNLPTTGPLYISALLNKDMYLGITFLIMLSILLVVGNLLADLLLAWVDPRVRLE